MISVILPAYNTPEGYLREAVESVLAQTCRDWELLVIDDSTTAPVEGIVKCYPDPRIRYFRNEKNIGMANSRNRGIELAKGEFIALLDHDDVWLPEKLEIQQKILQNSPSLLLTYSPVLFWDAGKTSAQTIAAEDTLYGLLRANFILTCSSVLLRSSVFRQLGLRFEQRFAPADDYALYLMIARQGGFARSAMPLLRYRIHADNISRDLGKMHRKLPALFFHFIRALWRAPEPPGKIRLTGMALRSAFWAYRNRKG